MNVIHGIVFILYLHVIFWANTIHDEQRCYHAYTGYIEFVIFNLRERKKSWTELLFWKETNNIWLET